MNVLLSWVSLSLIELCFCQMGRREMSLELGENASLGDRKIKHEQMIF